MAEIIGIHFKEAGKVYYFDPDNIKFNKGDFAIVETVRGVECGEVDTANSIVPDEEIVKPLKKVIRRAGPEDIKKYEEHKKKEKEAADIFRKRIEFHNLEMNLVDVTYTLDGSKVIFFYTAESRVDFRELVKDLASIFRTRIELKQIGIRDKAKMVGGLGICGRPICCTTFLDEFQPVTIKIAKEQGLSLNQGKISGACGKLMCCIKYEQEAYEHLLKITPKPGAVVETSDGKGKVVETSLLTGKLKIQLDNASPTALPRIYSRNDVKLIRDGKIQVDKEEIEALKNME